MLDLESIIEVYVSLEAPLLKMNEILNLGVNYFKDIGKYATFLILIEEIDNQNQLTNIQERIDKFVYKKLIIEKDLIKLIGFLKYDFKIAFEEIDTSILLRSETLFDKFKRLSNMEPKNVIEHIKEFKTNKDEIRLFPYHTQTIITTFHFIIKFPKTFSKIPKESELAFQQFKTQFEKEFELIRILNSKVGFDTNDDWYLLKKDTKHQKFLNS